jgi:PAS domain S-box-containing protein
MEDQHLPTSSLRADAYRLLIESVTDYAIFMLDRDGVVATWNPGAERLKGYRTTEILGQHFSRFYTDEDRATGLPARALEISAREGRFEHEGWRVRQDGSRFWASVIIDPIRDETGALVGYAKVTRDLTERRNAQRALEATREALFQSQKMEAVGRLTGGIAHDFNNLLMAILGSLELARKRLPDDPRVTPLIENAIQGGQRGVALTRRMLAFARYQELDRKPIELPSLVRGMADLLKQSLGPRITIETRFPLSLAPALADANQLEMALLNLATNARDAMPDGGSVIIAARDETVAGERGKVERQVCLSVTDSGIGMDEQTLARAAEPFYTTKPVGKGTGLGLSMIHGMAEQLGGRLVLKSRKGEGTTAEIWLPAAEAGSARAAAEAALAEQPAQSSRRLTVLAVDDDALVLMNTSAMLEDLGHAVLEATSGKEALGLLREHAVDLVITDQAMPHMSGAQLAEAIRAEWPAMPIVLVTGYAELPPGVDIRLPRLPKPFGQNDLAKAIALGAEHLPPTGRILRFRAR